MSLTLKQLIPSSASSYGSTEMAETEFILWSQAQPGEATQHEATTQKEERVVQESNLGILVLQIMNVSSFKKKKSVLIRSSSTGF